MVEQIVRGPLLVPERDGSVTFYFDGALAGDQSGTLRFAGDWREIGKSMPPGTNVRASDGVMLPPFLDIHTHVPQHPIRGRFLEGVSKDAPGGQLLNGLKRNVFPAETRCNERAYAEEVTRAFLADTLSHGVVGGACYVTPSAIATETALEILPDHWCVGLVLMNQNCPSNLCTNEATLEADVQRLAERLGPRLIITDRFAVAVSAPLCRRGSALAGRFNLRTQTHLNEQLPEKEMVEKVLYPDAPSYAAVYQRDGLLDHHCIVAHCIHMREDEWRILRDTNSVVAHCPTSNLLLGSGTMRLGKVKAFDLPYAIATDVGASPTVSMLAEIGRFLAVHQGQSNEATPEEALFRATRAPADILGLDRTLGTLAAGNPMSFIEVNSPAIVPNATAADVIRGLLPVDLDHPSLSISRVTIAGQVQFQRETCHA